MNSPEATIILKSPDGAWTTIGTEGSRGIVPEGIQTSANESGPDTCSFTLRREASVPWPDLLAFNRAEVWIGGALVWGGRIWEAPLSDADEDTISVTGRGWQYHLDDDQLQRFYVHTNMADYGDARVVDPACNIAVHQTGAFVGVGGNITLSWPKGYVVALLHVVHVIFDAGSTAIKRAVITWERIGVSASDIFLYSRGADDLNGSTGDDASVAFTGTSGVLRNTMASKHRYHHLFIYYGGAGGTFGEDQGVKITSVRTFGDTAYESSDASILKTSQVVTDVLGSGALPLLDSSTSAISTTAFSIPEFAPSGSQTPRSIIAAANAYEGNLFGVDASRILFLRERDTYPTMEVGPWPGSSFQDTSTNSGEGLYNRVIVQGTGPDGTQLSVSRYAADVPSTPASAFADVAGVANPGFETNTANWTAVLGSITRTTGADAHGDRFTEGSASAFINLDASALASVSTTLTNLTAGAMHAVRVHYRRATIDGGLVFRAEVSSGGVTIGSVIDTVPTDWSWRQPQVSFLATATTATLTISGDTVPFNLLLSGGAPFYFDDVHVYKVNASLLDRQGFVRTATLSVDSALTASGATELSDIWLNERRNPPLKGALVVGQGGARNLNGGEVHPSELMLKGGALIRLSQLVDPATGDQGRDGIIKSVSYNHDTETASLELDSERGRLETLLSRLAIVTSQIR